MAKLDFAVSDDGLLNFFDDVPEPVDRYEALIREVQLAEEVGFKYHFMIEHQNVHFGQIQSPMIYLSALAQRTSTIRFAQLVFATPFLSSHAFCHGYSNDRPAIPGPAGGWSRFRGKPVRVGPLESTEIGTA